MDFHVVIVNYNSENYVQSLYDSLKETSTEPFTYNICDNGSSDKSKAFLEDMKRKNERVSLYYRQQTDELPSSRHHAAAVDLILSQIPDNNYCLVIDVDCYMFAPEWQKLFINLLDSHKTDCVCTMIDVLGKKRVLPYIAFFRSEMIRQKKISFMPDIEKTLSGSKGFDFGYMLDEKCTITPLDILSPSPTLAGLPKTLVKKSMDFAHDGYLIAQHMKMGGRGFKAEFYGPWLDRCKSVGRRLLREGHNYV